MDDLILTVFQIQHEQDEAVQAFRRPSGPDNDLELGDYVNRYVCRAQVKKVVEFYQQIPVAGRPMHDVWADFLEALREAAGEGK